MDKIELFIEYVYEDEYGRPTYKGKRKLTTIDGEVFETDVNRRMYKKVDGVLHACTKDGEPMCKIFDGVTIVEL